MVEEINKDNYLEKKNISKDKVKEQLILDGETLDEIKKKKIKKQKNSLNE